MAQELNVPALKIEQLEKRSADEWTVEYDKHHDVLYMRIGNPRSATSVDLGEIWARVDPETGEVFGFEIEGFREVFLVRHPELPRPTGDAIQQKIEKASWVQVFMDFLRKVYSSDGSTGRFLPT